MFKNEKEKRQFITGISAVSEVPFLISL